MLTETRLGNVTDSRTYDGFGELQSYNVAANGMALFSVQYIRDLLLMIIQKVETINGETHSYAYDNAGNLREVRQDGSVVSQFSYDQNGNRLSHFVGDHTGSGDDRGTRVF
jgi:YD repeat-containing protein